MVEAEECLEGDVPGGPFPRMATFSRPNSVQALARPWSLCLRWPLRLTKAYWTPKASLPDYSLSISSNTHYTSMITNFVRLEAHIKAMMILLRRQRNVIPSDLGCTDCVI